MAVTRVILFDGAPSTDNAPVWSTTQWTHLVEGGSVELGLAEEMRRELDSRVATWWVRLYRDDQTTGDYPVAVLSFGDA